jgi:hypothetical protein
VLGKGWHDPEPEVQVMLNADIVFWPIVALMAASNLYFGPRIADDRVAMQWGIDGRPTWYAPKAIGLWGMVGFALAVRLFIWIASTYVPTKVHGVETGLLIASVVIAASYAFILKKAVQAG